MEIHGREIKFKRTVKATCDIYKLAPDGDLSKLDAMLESGDYSKMADVMIGFVVAMSKGYEASMAFEDLDYHPNPITEEEIMLLTTDELEELFKGSIAEWLGEKPTVEAKAPKQKGKNANGDSE